MDLYSEIICRQCGTIHRSQRQWDHQHTRYHFTCKRCGAEVHFRLKSIRWAVCPEQWDESNNGLETLPAPMEVVSVAVARGRAALTDGTRRLPDPKAEALVIEPGRGIRRQAR